MQSIFQPHTDYAHNQHRDAALFNGCLGKDGCDGSSSCLSHRDPHTIRNERNSSMHLLSVGARPREAAVRADRKANIMVSLLPVLPNALNKSTFASNLRIVLCPLLPKYEWHKMRRADDMIDGGRCDLYVSHISNLQKLSASSAHYSHTRTIF